MSTHASVKSLFPEPAPPTAGVVSGRCRFHDADDQRVVLVGGVVAFRYELTDRVGERSTWCSVYEGGWASYGQIAAATGISRRSVQYWVKRRRAEGVAGLIDRHRSGRPPVATSGLRRRVVRLREDGLSLRVIGRCVGVSEGTVRNVLKDARQTAEARQPTLSRDPPDEAGESTSVRETDGGLQEVQADTDSVDDPCLCAERPGEPVLLTEEVESCLALDRSGDRTAACLGQICDADPLFAPRENVQWAGMFLAFALLAADPLLGCAHEIYGRFSASFYGLRNTFMVLVAMALLRLARPEHLRGEDPGGLGGILGLDRGPEVKTLRRKLSSLYDADKAEALSRKLAAQRCGTRSEQLRVVHVDGHTVAYSGGDKIGETWSSRCRKVVKAQTENWVNLSDGTPLFAVTSEFNEGLCQALPEVLGALQQVIPGEKLLCSFDRGGYSAQLFEAILARGHAFVTYMRAPGDPLPDEVFVKQDTQIGDRLYHYAPHERQIALKVYKKINRGTHRKSSRRWTKRTVEVREVRIRRPDGGQTVILAAGTDLPARELSETLFGRVGAQENGFKYMRREFDLDGMRTYATEALCSDADHPNPRYVALEKALAKLREQRRKLLTQLGEIVAESAPADFATKLQGEDGEQATAQLAVLEASIDEQTRMLAETPVRERVADAGYRRLNLGSRILHNTIAATAWWLEQKLADIISPHYARAEDEAKTLVAAALKTPGRLRLEPGCIVVRLDPQAEPRRTRAVNALAEHITALGRRFPGSARRIVFESTPCPPARPRQQPKAQGK